MKQQSNYATLFLLGIVLIFTLGCAGSPTQESTGEYLSDTWITTKVKTALINDSIVKGSEVNVETFKGIVQLSGFVSTAEAMEQAIAVASSIEGVTSVKNDMQLK